MALRLSDDSVEALHRRRRGCSSMTVAWRLRRHGRPDVDPVAARPAEAAWEGQSLPTTVARGMRPRRRGSTVAAGGVAAARCDAPTWVLRAYLGFSIFF